VTQISISNVAVEFGSTRLFSDVTFTVGAGERWGIVGRNGTGKSTLFKLITGEMQPTRGAVVVQPGVRLSLLEQHREFAGATTVWEAAAGQFAELLALEASLAEQAAALAADASEAALARYGRDLERFEREGGYEIAPRVDAILQGLGFDPTAARTIPVARLSGGERGRLGLARQIASPADVLMLDEPTNHLDLETTRWLEQYLLNTQKTVMLVSHDRAFLDAVVNHVLHFEAETATPYVGDYQAFVTQHAERQLAQQRAFDKQQRVISAEQEYIARNIAGVNSRQAKGRRKRLTRMARLSPPPGADGTMALRFTPAERGGDRVVIAEHATIAVPDEHGERVLIEDFTGFLSRGEVLGLVGPNGAGKSTFLKTLLGERVASSGELRLGGSITAAYYRQDLSQVPLDRPLYEVIADLRPLWERRLVQGHLGRFGFSGDEVQRRADSLSGGERARLALAMLMLGRANLLILDEPTNHLDVESIEALEDALEDYDGTVILVSHDRALLRALTTRVWVMHGTRLTDFAGGFDEWEVVAAERAHAAAVNAAEEESLRRVRERQKTARVEQRSEDSRKAVRRAARAVEDAESRIERIEGRIAAVTAQLEDPELYTRPEGAAQATSLGKELDGLRADLDAALAEWSAATDELQRIGGAS
jgi:ATP-binding cassette subfamily F protein 3